MLRVFSQFLIVSCGCAFLAAQQEPLRVDPAVAAQNLVKKVDPWVPTIAKMTNVGGMVRMEVTISAAGRVSNTKILSGHPMLRQSFINAVKQWEYKPFTQDGKPIAVITEVEWTVPVEKRTDSEEKAIGEFYPAEEVCRTLIREQKWVEAETKCRHAVSISDELPSERILERSGGRALLGHTLLWQRRWNDAISVYEEAVRIDSQRHDEDDEHYASLHASLARAYFLGGRHSDADFHYGRAVKIFEAAIVSLPEYKDSYGKRLKNVLLEWVKLKEKVGQLDDAKQLAQKAARL